MFRIAANGLIFLCIIGMCDAGVITPDATLTIPLNKTVSNENREIYGEFIQLNASSILEVNFSDASENITFIILQVHSHMYNISLYDKTLSKNGHISGTNVGMYSKGPAFGTFFVINSNKKKDLKLYVSVHGYFYADPIPGGCNMEFSIPTSPFLVKYLNADYIYVDAAAPRLFNDTSCREIDQEMIFYRMFLPEGDLTEDVYFDGIRKMMVLETIREYGEVIPVTGTMWNMRRMLATYRGTGSVYVAVVYAGARYSVYVPTYTYGCDPLDENDGCYVLDDVLSQFMCAALLFVGAFVCYFGHQFFRIEMFLVGCASGALVTYIVISIIAEIGRPTLITASLMSGACFGAIWLIFWWMYGFPLISVYLITLIVGFLVGSIMYYRLPGGVPVLENEFNFWTLFIFMMLLTSVTLISITFLSNILCCCILGGYAVIYPIDYYMGSSLKYIVINVVRRATVPKFNKAIVSPPFELNDALLTLLWVALSLTGFLVQYYNSRGRPPFPPPPRNVILRAPSPDFGPQYYGSFSRSPSRPPSRSPSRPPSRMGSRNPILIPQALIQSLHTAMAQRGSSDRTPLLS